MTFVNNQDELTETESKRNTGPTTQGNFFIIRMIRTDEGSAKGTQMNDAVYMVIRIAFELYEERCRIYEREVNQ